MIIFLSVLCAVSAFGDETLIAKRDGPTIKIEWTKTEKLEISIPVIVEAVKAPIYDNATSPMTTSLNATTTSPATETPTDASVDNTNLTATTTDSPGSTVWSEESTLESAATTDSSNIGDEDSTNADTFSEDPEATTTFSSINAEENTSTISETIAPEATTTFFSTTAEDSKTIYNVSNEPEITLTTTTITSTTPPTTTTTTAKTAPPCEETQGKDFIFLIDGATAKEQSKTEELIEVFLNVINKGHPCDRIALVSYGESTYQQKVLIPLRVGVDNAAAMDALRTVNYTQHNNLVTAIGFVRHTVLSKPDYTGIRLKNAGKERIVVIVATAEGSAGEDWKGGSRQMFPENAAASRAHIMDQYGAKILFVTIGQPLFPVFQFIAPDDETVKIESFDNFSPLTVVTEFCCRFSLCPDNEKEETEMCARVKAREIEKQILYPKCAEEPARPTDAIILIDKAGMNHRNEIISLSEKFLTLIDPWKTANRMQIESYDNGSTFLSSSDTKEVMLEKIGKIEYRQGSDLARAISHSSNGFGIDNWQNRSRQRIIIMIAGAVPSVETGGMEGCMPSHVRNFIECAQDRMGYHRSTKTGMFGAKMFLITIGDLPTEILRQVAPEKEIVKIESGEKFSPQPIIEEFKRRFCM